MIMNDSVGHSRSKFIVLYIKDIKLVIIKFIIEMFLDCFCCVLSH